MVSRAALCLGKSKWCSEAAPCAWRIWVSGSNLAEQWLHCRKLKRYSPPRGWGEMLRAAVCRNTSFHFTLSSLPPFLKVHYTLPLAQLLFPFTPCHALWNVYSPTPNSLSLTPPSPTQCFSSHWYLDLNQPSSSYTQGPTFFCSKYFRPPSVGSW